MRIAEVTEIQFVTEELVDVAAQCLVDIAKEMESMDNSVGATDAATAAPNQSEKESTEAKPASPEAKKESETTVEGSSSQSRQMTKESPPLLLRRRLKVPQHHESSQLLKQDDESSKESSQDWITRFLKGGHDLPWPTGLASSMCPTLLTGLNRQF